MENRVRPRESASAAAPSGSATLAVAPRTVEAALVGASLLLGVASYAMHLVVRARGGETLALLDVGDEVSLGTWFETLLFAIAAVVLLFGGRSAANLSTRWYVLSGVMLALSIDEAASMHERLGSGLRDIVDASGWLYYIWVVPALVFVAAVALYELPWLRSLPTDVAKRVVLSGVVFVGGAAFMELLAGPEAEANGTGTLLSISFSAVEELCEMVGLSLFIGAILRHLSGRLLSIAVKSSDGRALGARRP